MHSCPKSSVFESHRRNQFWLFQECIFLGAESLDDVHYVTEASSSAWPTRILLYPRRWLSRKWMIFSLSSAASSFSVDSKWRELSCRADYERDRFLLLSILPWSGASLLTVAFGCFSSRLKDHQQRFLPLWKPAGSFRLTGWSSSHPDTVCYGPHSVSEDAGALSCVSTRFIH